MKGEAPQWGVKYFSSLQAGSSTGLGGLVSLKSKYRVCLCFFVYEYDYLSEINHHAGPELLDIYHICHW